MGVMRERGMGHSQAMLRSFQKSDISCVFIDDFLDLLLFIFLTFHFIFYLFLNGESLLDKRGGR